MQQCCTSKVFFKKDIRFLSLTHMDSTHTVIDLLKSHQLRSTAVRKQVLELFLQSKHAIGKINIEQELEEIDRITLYRTLRTFEQKGIIHQAMDGSGKTKYALCSHKCDEHKHHDHHAHFHCKSCKKTICMDEISLPKLAIPEGYQIESAQLILSGKCNECK